MSGISLLEVGSTVPLWLQIEDGAADQYPQVEIRDDEDNLLQTFDLPHVSGGLYRAGSYSMPAEDKIVCLYIVYSDAAHTIESLVYLRDLDIFRAINPDQYKATGFATENPPSQILADYKATGFSTHDANDVKTSLEVSGSKLSRIYDNEIIRSGTVSTIVSQFLEFNTNLSEAANNYWTRGALRWTSGNNEGTIRKIQIYSAGSGYIKLRTEAVNPIQVNDTFDIIPLRAFRVNYEDISQIAGEVDTELTGIHGVGSWQEGGGATPAEINAELTANHGDGSWQKGGDAQEATSLAIQERTDRIPDQPAPASEYVTVLTDIMTEVAGLNGGSIPSVADVTAAIFDKIVEGTLTFNDFQRIMFAMLSGTSSGHGVVGPKIYKSEDGLIDRIAFTCDPDSNRLSRVLDPS